MRLGRETGPVFRDSNAHFERLTLPSAPAAQLAPCCSLLETCISQQKVRNATGRGGGASLSHVNSCSSVPGNRIDDKDVTYQLTCTDCLLGARDCSKNFASPQQPCETGTAMNPLSMCASRAVVCTVDRWCVRWIPSLTSIIQIRE